VLLSLGAPLWDTSDVLPQTTAVGTLLHALIGYNAQPAGMQTVFYVVALVAIAADMRWVAPRGQHGAKNGTPRGASPYHPAGANLPPRAEVARSASASRAT
jgi:hypothetical protein